MSNPNVTFFFVSAVSISPSLYKSAIPSRQSSHRHTSSPIARDDKEPRLEVESRESVRISGRSGRAPPPAANSIFLANNDSIKVRCLPDTIDAKGSGIEEVAAAPVSELVKAGWPLLQDGLVGVVDIFLDIVSLKAEFPLGAHLAFNSSILSTHD